MGKSAKQLIWNKDLGKALDHGREGVVLRGSVGYGGAFGGHGSVQLAHLADHILLRAWNSRQYSTRQSSLRTLQNIFSKGLGLKTVHDSTACAPPRAARRPAPPRSQTAPCGPASGRAPAWWRDDSGYRNVVGVCVSVMCNEATMIIPCAKFGLLCFSLAAQIIKS